MKLATGRGWAMYLGDCIEVMQQIERVDHVITDPPYEAEAHTKARRALVDSTQKRGARNAGKVRRIDQPLEIDFGAIAPDVRIEAARLFGALAKRWVLAFCQIEAVAAWRAAFEAGGLDWVRGAIWRKPNGAPQFTGDRPGQGFESLAIGHQSGRKRWNGGGKHGVWECPLDHGAGNGRRNEHSTQKPVGLMMELIHDFTDRDDVVLDAFAGSGTTGVACLRFGRRFVGIERNPKYFALAVERLRAEEGSTTLQASRAGQMPLLSQGTR